MSSIREQITAQVLARLNGAGKPGGVPAAARAGAAAARLGPEPNHRSIVLKKRWSGGRPQRPAPAERIGGRGGPTRRHYLNLDFELRAAGDGTAPPDGAVEEMHAWLIRALVGSQLEGLALDVREGPIQFAYAQGGYPLCMARARIVVEHLVPVEPPPATGPTLVETLLPTGGREDNPLASFGVMESIATGAAQLADGLDATYDETRLTDGGTGGATGSNFVIWTMQPSAHSGAIAFVRHRFRVAALASPPEFSAIIRPCIDGIPRGTPRVLLLDGLPQTIHEDFPTLAGTPWTTALLNSVKWGWFVQLEAGAAGSVISGRVMELQVQVIAP